MFKDKDDDFVRNLDAGKYIEFINEFAKSRECSIAQLCFDYVAGLRFVADILIGCETHDQLMENVSLFSHMQEVSADEYNYIDRFMESCSDKIINPALWNRI